MASEFTGFSEDDLRRIKLKENGQNNDPTSDHSNIKKLDKIGAKPKKLGHQYKLSILQNNNTDDAIDSIVFDKCRLSLKTPTSSDNDMLNNNAELKQNNDNDDLFDTVDIGEETMSENNVDSESNSIDSQNPEPHITPDIVRGVENYTEHELAAHKIKLEHLQLQRKIMEEQNKKRKEMLSKALADRTRQTEEEVLRLEKIKKELQVLDGQFSVDVAVLRKKIDQACLSYADAEKHYLKVEKEFLQAKINLQKEKEKKELLTEHLCALITHNETRKAQKLETLMHELASDKKTEPPVIAPSDVNVLSDDEEEPRIVVHGVDEMTGKMVEM